MHAFIEKHFNRYNLYIAISLPTCNYLGGGFFFFVFILSQNTQSNIVQVQLIHIYEVRSKRILSPIKTVLGVLLTFSGIR